MALRVSLKPPSAVYFRAVANICRTCTVLSSIFFPLVYKDGSVTPNFAFQEVIYVDLTYFIIWTKDIVFSQFEINLT